MIFKIDGTKIGNTLTSAPFSIDWNTQSVANGNHTISATANDAAGNDSTVSVKVNVINSQTNVDNVSPEIRIDSPSNLTNVKNIVSISAIATDNVSVAWVKFDVNGNQIGDVLTSQPYVTNWNTNTLANGLYVLNATAGDAAGNTKTAYIYVIINNTVTDVTEGQDLPHTFALKQNYPNPFNPTTTIVFDIPNSSYVTLDVFDVLGEKVASLVDGYLGAGRYNAVWNADRFSSGIYIYQLRAGNVVIRKKMNFMK